MAIARKVMVAFDFSEYAEAALKYACDLAKDQEAELLVANVIHQRHIDALKMVENATNTLRVDEFVADQQRERFREMTEIVQKNGCQHLSFRILVEVGTPFKELLRLIKAEKADLLVMGNKGRSNIAGIFFGSTAEKMFRHCPVPLLSIRPENFRQLDVNAAYAESQSS